MLSYTVKEHKIQYDNQPVFVRCIKQLVSWARALVESVIYSEWHKICNGNKFFCYFKTECGFNSSTSSLQIFFRCAQRLESFLLQRMSLKGRVFSRRIFLKERKIDFWCSTTVIQVKYIFCIRNVFAQVFHVWQKWIFDPLCGSTYFV